MRAPEGGAPPAELYRAALEMAEWGEANGCLAVQVSEHHGSPDGYLPAPLVLAAAIAGRTRRLPIQVAALILPLHDPIELAEQMAVLDLTSGGRVSYVLAVGYREEEYAACGRDFATRGRRMDACLAALAAGLPRRGVRVRGPAGARAAAPGERRAARRCCSAGAAPRRCAARRASGSAC